MSLGRVFLAGEQGSYACEWLWKILQVRPCDVFRTENLNLLLAETGRMQLPRLILLHTSLGGSRLYDFCRVFKNRFPTVPLFLIADRVEARVRQWAVLQGATDLVSVTTEDDRRALVQQLDQLLAAPQTETAPKAVTATSRLLEEYRKGFRVSEVVAGLNQLAKAASQYLGKLIVTNYWRSTREDLATVSPVLDFFTVEFGQEIIFKENREFLSIEESLAIQQWVGAFIARAQTVVQDLPDLLQAVPLSQEQRLLLCLR